MFEMRPTAELIQIAAAGGGFSIKAAMRPTADLIQIAAVAKSRVVFRGLNMRTTAEIIQISAAGKGNVFFDDGD